MSNEQFEPQANDFHHLAHIKAGLLAAWHELPAHDQALVFLALHEQVMSGEHAAWIGQTLARLHCTSTNGNPE